MIIFPEVKIIFLCVSLCAVRGFGGSMGIL